MRLHFTKMHGLGNDFVVLDQVTHPTFISQKQIKEMSNRQLGIGFDQLIFIEAPLRPDADFHYRVFNADGREIEHCGNGARCFYRYVRDKHLTWKKTIKVSTENGALIELTQAGQNLVSVTMEAPQFSSAQIPVTQDQPACTLYPLTVKDETFEVGLVSVGNPHCVLLVSDINAAPVKRVGHLIRHHEYFPQQVNVGFMEVVTPTRAKLRVYERGAGETQACGTGACAAFAIGRTQGWLDERIRVELPGGILHLVWKGQQHQMMMIGPAETVFEGHIDL